MATAPPAPAVDRTSPWYRQVTTDQWRAFAAAYLGWMLDGFDYVILSFLLVDIQRYFGVSTASAGALLTASLLFRVVGGLGAGAAADRWGRKGPLMLSILWYAVFTFVSGFSTSYAMLLTCRALFGIGMGGVWAAGMPLALEHWPTHLRGIASGLLQGGYAMGYLLSAVVYQFIYPIARDQVADGWRVLLWMGILPAFLVPWIRLRVKESPIWLERQQYLHDSNQRQTMPLSRLFTGDLRAITIQTSLLMGAQLFLYNAIAPLYPTFLNQRGLQPLLFVVAFNAGGIGGALLFGRLSEGRLGRRGSAALATTVGIAAIPLYVFAESTTWLAVGAGAMGLFGTGNFGVVPGYLNERFPTAARAAGAGFSYQAGAALAAFGPALIGSLVDGGMPLASAMAWCMAVSSVLLIVLLALGPETRGRVFQAHT